MRQEHAPSRTRQDRGRGHLRRQEWRRALRLVFQIAAALVLAPLLILLGPLLVSGVYALVKGRPAAFCLLIGVLLAVGVVAFGLLRALDDRRAAARLRRRRRSAWRDAF